MEKKIKLWLYLLLLPGFLKSQDTIFVNRHIFTAPVRNVFKAENDIYVKTGDGVFKRKKSTWVKQEMNFTKAYVFYNNDFFQSDNIPQQYSYDAQHMSYLIPQNSIAGGTMAELNNKMFVSVGGSLFEYNIPTFYSHLYKKNSIRDIYIEKGLKVVSTYSGIYINDTIKAAEPTYSSGYFCKVLGNYYLCNDKLYAYTSPGIFSNIESGTNVFAGAIHKLVVYQGNIYSLHNKSINILDSAYNLTPIHQNFRYNDLETVDSLLVFCTNTGELFQFDGHKVKYLLTLKSRVRDIYQFGKILYLSSDDGVYTLQNLKIETLTLLAKLPYSVKVHKDQFNNVWISTENGLFVLPDKQKNPIPLIEGVEFNGRALTYYEDDIYAGSINGLYVINIYKVHKYILPAYLNNKSKKETIVKQIISLSLALLVLLLIGLYYYYKRHNKVKVSVEQKEQIVLSLDKIEQDITLNKIMTVDSLAEFYKTNPVQLNRLFKTFDTTPGKFMKKVKLEFAKELLKNGETIEQVASKVGYSATYIKNEFSD